MSVKLNLGCGDRKLLGFINIDIDERAKPDLVWDLNKIPYPFEDESVDYILSESNLEHLLIDVYDFLKECKRILKYEGTLEILTPNMYCLQVRFAYLFGRIHWVGNWSPYHNKLIPPKFLKHYLQRLGFTVTNALRWKFMSDWVRPHIHLKAKKRR